MGLGVMCWPWGLWGYVSFTLVTLALKIAIKKTYNAEEISKGLTLSHRLVPKQLTRFKQSTGLQLPALVCPSQHQRPGTTDPQHPEHLG